LSRRQGKRRGGVEACSKAAQKGQSQPRHRMTVGARASRYHARPTRTLADLRFFTPLTTNCSRRASYVRTRCIKERHDTQRGDTTMLRDETSERERALVLRPDRPRHIDAVIDYFGELRELSADEARTESRKAMH